MPTLKQLTCNIEWGNISGVPFKEYGTSYGDGVVESYVAIPNHPAPFSIRLKSHGYISSGLAMFVFADGVYQCNRSRDTLKYPENPAEPDEKDKTKCEVNFLVRQREEIKVDDVWIGRKWRFEPLNLVEPNSTHFESDARSHFKYLGTIQVVVLRCTARPGDFADTWGQFASSRSLSPESATAPVLDFEDSTPANEEQRKNVKQTDSLWAVYDGPGDCWQNNNRRSSQWSAHGTRNEGDEWSQRSVGRDQGWGGSEGSRRSTNPSVVVNIHTRGPRDSGPNWRNRPLSPQSQRNSGCYSIRNGRRVHGSRDWRQERSPSTNSQACGNDQNPSDWNNTDRNQNGGEQPSEWNSQPQENNSGGDTWRNVQENNQGNDDRWTNSQNDNNNDWNGGNPDKDWGNDQNNHANTDDWAHTSNGQKDWGNNNEGGNTWENTNWEDKPQDNNQTGTDGWVHVDHDDTSNNANNFSGNTGNDLWGNGDDAQNHDQTNNDNRIDGNNNQWGDNNVNESWGNGNANQQPSNDWGEDDKVASAGRPSSPVPPLHPQAQQYRPPSSHGEFPNRSEGKKPGAFVTPRLIQATRHDEPLLYNVPEDVAKEKLTTHQVQPGPSVPYTHKIGTPDYLDTIEKPYAMFVFKYRQKEVIEQLLEINIERDVEAEKRKLESLPRETIVDQLLRAQGILGDHIPPPTQNGQNEQKWRAEYAHFSNYTTTPVGQERPVKNGCPRQPSSTTNIPANANANANAPSFANVSSWGPPEVIQPTPSTYEQKATSNQQHGGWYGNVSPEVAPINSPAQGSPKNCDWSHQSPMDVFGSSLSKKLQDEADKRSATSKDSWATRTTTDARKRDIKRGLSAGHSNASRRGSGGGSQNNAPATSWGGASVTSRKSGSVKSKYNQSNASQGGIVAGPWQTYQPSNSGSQRGVGNGNTSNLSGNKSGQDTSGNSSTAAPAGENFW